MAHGLTIARSLHNRTVVGLRHLPFAFPFRHQEKNIQYRKGNNTSITYYAIHVAYMSCDVSPLSQIKGRYCHAMFKFLYPSIRVRTAPPVSVRVRVRVSVSFSFTV